MIPEARWTEELHSLKESSRPSPVSSSEDSLGRPLSHGRRGAWSCTISMSVLVGIVLVILADTSQGLEDSLMDKTLYSPVYANYYKRFAPASDYDETSYTSKNLLFPRTSRENPVSMLRLKKMSMMRLKKANSNGRANPMESSYLAADSNDLVSKRMSMMRLKKPSMMRLRRMPPHKSVSMLRLKKAVTQLRLKKGDKDLEQDCLWISDQCVNLDAINPEELNDETIKAILDILTEVPQSSE